MMTSHKVNYTLSLRFIVSHPDCDPDAIARQTGIVPTHTSAKMKLWEVESPASIENSSVERQWQALHPIVGPHQAFFSSLPSGWAHTMLVVEARVFFPGIIVPPSLMQFCTTVGASLELDTYFEDSFILQPKLGMRLSN